MPDIGSLVTHLPSDKGYTGESPAKGGLPGFVCPRADAYGGREGIISPGVAAVNDLVPRGMRRIATADTAKSANAARTDGRTESDRYLEYYGRAVPAQYSRQAGRTARPERQVRRQEVRDQAACEQSRHCRRREERHYAQRLCYPQLHRAEGYRREHHREHNIGSCDHSALRDPLHPWICVFHIILFSFGFSI